MRAEPAVNGNMQVPAVALTREFTLADYITEVCHHNYFQLIEKDRVATLLGLVGAGLALPSLHAIDKLQWQGKPRPYET